MNNLPKNWFASKTIWASLLTTIWPLFLVLAKQFNIPLPDADSTAALLATGGTLVAAGVAVYGRITAKAPIASPKAPAGTVSAIIAFLIVGSLSACTASQQAAVQSAIAANTVKIADYCISTIVPDANSLPADILAMLVPQVADAKAAGIATCQNIEAAAASSTTQPWMATLDTIMRTKGRVLPAPIAPLPITVATVPTP